MVKFKNESETENINFKILHVPRFFSGNKANVQISSESDRNCKIYLSS